MVCVHVSEINHRKVTLARVYTLSAIFPPYGMAANDSGKTAECQNYWLTNTNSNLFC